MPFVLALQLQLAAFQTDRDFSLELDVRSTLMVNVVDFPHSVELGLASVRRD
jgi:hypothetical protein